MASRRAAWLRIVGALGVACSAVVTDARAEEPADPLLAKVVACEAKVAEHAMGKAYEPLVQDCKEALALYKEAAGKDPYRQRLIKLMGGLAKHRNDDVCRAGLLALGEAGDPDGARYVKPYLRPTEDPEPSVGLMTALDVAGKLGHDSLVEPLLLIVEDSKNFSVASKAMEALGGFGHVKRKREKILEVLVKTVLKDRPGVRGQGSGPNEASSVDTSPEGTSKQGEGAAARFATLSATLPKALNHLTGQNVSSAEEWFTAARENKSKLGDLFKEREAAGS